MFGTLKFTGCGFSCFYLAEQFYSLDGVSNAFENDLPIPNSLEIVRSAGEEDK